MLKDSRSSIYGSVVIHLRTFLFRLNNLKTKKAMSSHLFMAQLFPNENGKIVPVRLAQIFPSNAGTIVPNWDWQDCFQVKLPQLFPIDTGTIVPSETDAIVPK